MIKGFYAAASAMVAGMHRQNILAQNIANLDTPGFRQILLAMDDWYVTPITQAKQDLQPIKGINTLRQLGYLGLGTDTSSEITDYSQGSFKSTSEELDFAIQGAGFFRVQTPEGERYTRDGRFLRDANNQLVTVDGYKVLDTNGNAIKLPTGQVSVDETGLITINNQQVTKIGLAAFNDPQTELVRAGTNTFTAAGGSTSKTTGTVEQGYLEMTNSNLESLMTQMVIVGRAYEANQRIVGMQDDILGKVINNLNRL
ncbi:MAG: flagellar hook-basal body protein [Anaerolineales bacterium]|jgi:flagellar basal body rod protein FlgG|nr:flagellar hook-basal body protein [Anaerolineales bacterium]